MAMKEAETSRREETRKRSVPGGRYLGTPVGARSGRDTNITHHTECCQWSSTLRGHQNLLLPAAPHPLIKRTVCPREFTHPIRVSR